MHSQLYKYLSRLLEDGVLSNLMFDTSEEAFRKMGQSVEDLAVEFEKKSTEVTNLKGDLQQYLAVKEKHPMLIFLVHGMLMETIDKIEALSKAVIKLEYRILRQSLQIDFLRGVRWIISEQVSIFHRK